MLIAFSMICDCVGSALDGLPAVSVLFVPRRPDWPFFRHNSRTFLAMRTRINTLLFRTRCSRRIAIALPLAIALVGLHVAMLPRVAAADWPSLNPFAKEEPVGSPGWWKKNKRKAVFEVEKGWKVEGVDGYFDDDGRPIQGPVATERIIKAGEDDDEIGLIPGLDPRVQYSKMKEAVGLGPNDKLAREAYAEGDRLFREKKYGAAAKKFKEAVSRGPHSQIEQDAMFMLAESYFFDDRYIKARDAYDELVKEFPSTRYMDTLIDHEWRIAQYWEQYEDYSPDWALTPQVYDRSRPWLDTIGHAIKTYDNIRLNDPTGPRADDAIMATANIYFRRGRYDDADYHYTLLRTQYPRSELQFEAHLLGLQAKLRKYQGADYDGTPLEEAKQLVKQLRMQFAGRLSKEETERLRVVEGQLNLEIATRDYRMAEYNDGTKHYGAARYYYRQVIKKYPDTELAKQARERIAEIGGEPDTPPKRLAWFVDLFPKSSERSRVANIPEIKEGGGRLARQPATPTSATTADGSSGPAVQSESTIVR
jgi:TolA-binding protein